MTEATNHIQDVPRCQSVSAVLWPSFIVAGLLTIFFFAMFDPMDLLASQGIESLSRTAVYSLGFFCFWIMTALSSAATRYFLKPCELVNRTKK